jgi:CheY-like chemotaxis protein
MGPEEPLRADLNEILMAANRSADIIRQLLGFARRQTIAPRVLNLNEAVVGMLKMLRRLIGEDIDLAWLPESELWPIMIDPAQVDQIMVNLCVNARDAIAGVGKITIETGNIGIDEAHCADHAGYVPGDYVLLVVSDDGSGMAPEIINKVFEPFFSTKSQDKGTGLGLATVYGIVKQNRGFINIYSEPDEGSTIKIYLPRHMGQSGKAFSESSWATSSSRGETILVVEDEPSILRLTRKMLQGLGYSVLTANTPSQAMALAKEHPGKIQMVITDVVMPEMTGRDLADRLHSIDPSIKLLFMSGYTANVIAQRGVLDEGIIFIQKPFSRESLAAKVREVLDHVES